MGAKGARNPVGFMGSLSSAHRIVFLQQRCKGCNRGNIVKKAIIAAYTSDSYHHNNNNNNDINKQKGLFTYFFAEAFYHRLRFLNF